MSSYDNGVRRRSPVIGDLQIEPVDSLSADTNAAEPVDVLLELNLRYPGGRVAVTRALSRLWDSWSAVARPAIDGGPPVHADPAEPAEPADADPAEPAEPAEPADADPLSRPRRVSSHIYQVVVTRAELDQLITADRNDRNGGATVIFKAWPDYALYPLIDRSAATVKAPAAWRSYQALGKEIVWAVIDSGIQADHQHFADLLIAGDIPADATPPIVAAIHGAAAPVSKATGFHRDFTSLVAPSQLGPLVGPGAPLTDELGHGSHVAGIIAGQGTRGSVVVAASDEPSGSEGFVQRTPGDDLWGMAPNCQLVSLKVMRKNLQGDWVTSSAAIIAALEYIRTDVNVSRSAMQIHGVNISLGCDWDPAHYAAGQSPLCQAVDELVASGVVVVISAGNGGSTGAPADAKQNISLMGTVTEPGHAEGAITVGSTHRDAPLAFGVSWRSGKGPTLDGRSKPDVIAPGEWITSVAVGNIRATAGLNKPGIDPRRTYAEQSGTSMAAPHVSGVIAGFLSARPEFIGRPQQVKELMCRTATDLGRERYAQGHGLIDAMRMLSDS